MGDDGDGLWVGAAAMYGLVMLKRMTAFLSRPDNGPRPDMYQTRPTCTEPDLSLARNTQAKRKQNARVSVAVMGGERVPPGSEDHGRMRKLLFLKEMIHLSG